jgi:O-antigen ligase
MHPLSKQKPISVNALFVFAVIILGLRIISYFSFSDDVTFTQIYKAGLRICLTVIVLSVSIQLRQGYTKFTSNFNRPLPVWLYGGYLFLGLTSLLWTTSINDSLMQLVMDLEGYVFALFFMQMIGIFKEKYQSLNFHFDKILAFSILPVAMIFAIGMYVDPDNYYRLTHGGQVSRLGGYIINPNELGMLLVVGIACWLPQLNYEGKFRVSRIIIIAFLIWLLILTESRSSFVGMLLVISAYAIFQKSKVFKFILVAGMFVLIPLVGVGIFIKQNDIEEVISLTGRIPFWKDLLTYNFPKAPWFGYGYMRIDFSDKFESINAYAGAMTHNTFLQVLLGLGLAGFTLVLTQISSFFHAIFYCKDKAIKQVVCMVFIPVLINSMTEFGIFGETNFGILFYLMLVFAVSMETINGSRRITDTIKPDAKNSNLPIGSMSTA